MASKTDFVTWLRNVATSILNDDLEGRGVIKHYQGLDYATAANLTDEQIQAIHPDLTRDDVVAAIVSLDAVSNFIDTGGHRTNLERIRRLLT
jgi:hypothetical protein